MKKRLKRLAETGEKVLNKTRLESVPGNRAERRAYAKALKTVGVQPEDVDAERIFEAVRKRRRK